jgi:glucans biosynthesis protein C
MISSRRYDIDWLRVIAIGLLLIYHTAIAFQPWGFMIGFITNKESITAIWLLMAMLNIWRIPLLFFISGMGTYFVLQNGSWKRLITERTKRILLPFLTGFFIIVPLQIFVIQQYYHQPFQYKPDAGHLWFLGNIFAYNIIFLLIVISLTRYRQAKLFSSIRKFIATPYTFLIVIVLFIAEAMLTKPMIYELYAFTWHGFFLGLIGFLAGFCFMQGGNAFWSMLNKWRWVFLLGAITLYIIRLIQPQIKVANEYLAIESCCWVFSIFGFGNRHLNRGGKTLSYLSEAAYPVYILHMLFLYIASVLIFPLNLNPGIKFILTLLFTTAGSFIFFEIFIRRLNTMRFFFGLKPRHKKTTEN